MPANTVRLPQPGSATLSSSDPEPAETPCPFGFVTHVVRYLLSPALDPEAVRARAVALGLLRHTGPAKLRLNAQAAARLFLAGYRLPAHVDLGDLRRLRHSLGEGWLVFVPFRPAEEAEPEVVLVHSYQEEEKGDPWLLVTRLGESVAAVQSLGLPQFAGGWAAAGGLLVTAARLWSDLPREGSRFFGGSRGNDGVYHWDSAECDTDGEGRILRY
jgi:hypothetical protein